MVFKTSLRLHVRVRDRVRIKAMVRDTITLTLNLALSVTLTASVARFSRFGWGHSLIGHLGRAIVHLIPINYLLLFVISAHSGEVTDFI